MLFVHGEPTWSFLWRRVLVPIRDAQAHAADSVLPLETGRRFAAALGGELAHVIEDASHRRTPGPRSAA